MKETIDLIKSIVKFNLNPKNNIKAERWDWGTLINIYVLKFSISLPIYCIIASLLSIGDSETTTVATSSPEPFAWTYYLYNVLFLSVIVHPILEEWIFRRSIIFKPRYWAFSLSVIVTIGLSYLNVLPPLRFGGVLLYMIIIYAILEYTFKMFETQMKHFNYKNLNLIYWGLGFLFAFLHIFNFDLTPNKYIYSVVIILPYLIASMVYGYVRMKYGITASIFLHMLNNFIPSIFYLLLI